MMRKFALLACLVWLGSGPREASAEIANIHAFLETCPTNDPAYTQIRQDFIILRNGSPVGTLACSEPISAIPIAQYTDELILLQGLRVLYYVDRERTNHLPWTTTTIYDWMRSRIRGFDLNDSAGSYCCDEIGGQFYAVIRTQNDESRDFDRTWRGISGNIGLYAHEARHRDGFLHDSGCGIPYGCDPVYDEANLSSYGIQWWLDASWLSGHLHVGFACADSMTVSSVVAWHLSGANGTFRTRFSSNPPPLLSAPALPGGGCRPTMALGVPANVRTFVSPAVLTISWQAPASGATPTAYRLDFFAGVALVYSTTVAPVTTVQLNIPAGVQGIFTATVTALAAFGAGPPSTPVSFGIGVGPCAVPPAVPTVIGTLVAGVGTVAWSAVTEATSYFVLAGSVFGASDLFSANVGPVTSVSAAGLPAGFRAFVRIVAMNGCGQSAPSATIVLQ